MPKGVYKKSEEHKNKIRLSRLGKPLSLETRKKISISSMGKNKGNVPWIKGKHITDEHKLKLSLFHKGKKKSELTKLKMSESKKGKCFGENNNAWKKDRNSLAKDDKKHLDTIYKYWMLGVKKRDKFKCRIINSDCRGRLESHHIFNWVDYPELRYEINNGITLCQFHHPRGREEEKRMIPIFQELLSVSEE